ncbi:hypothetical protein N3Z17_06000 [Candidatus Bandiella numerosa]|uniref:hypothetical protein n=1 Tax=Candidatus Bandiella numerosa TaxID=2570586 RepID=UPI00249F5A4F|nr:hypothetical protein [Candidatus Bandiella numerosa]WHA04770.1 hypothetical protein N3Z17_06000 [Candidatus Bandiella numerosa]
MSRIELIEAGLKLLNEKKIESTTNSDGAIEAFKSISHALNYIHEFVRGSYSIVDEDCAIYNMLFTLTKKINEKIKDDNRITNPEIVSNSMPKLSNVTDVAYKRFSSHYKDSQKKTTQFGVDISEGLPHQKKTILFGRVDEDGGKKTFFKLEEHGTYGFKANILHGLDFMKAVDPKDKDFSEKRISKKLRDIIKRIIKGVVNVEGNINDSLSEDDNELIKLINGGGNFKVSALTSIFDKFNDEGKKAYANFLKDDHSEESQDLTISRIPNKTGSESVIQTKDITEALEKIKKDGTINDKDSLHMSQYISNNTDTGNVPLTKNQVALYKSYCDYNTNDNEIEPTNTNDDVISVTSETVNEYECVNESKVVVKHEYWYINERKAVVETQKIGQQIEKENKDTYEYMYSEKKAVKVPKVQYNSYEYVNSNLNSNDLNKPIITNYHINDNSDDENFFDCINVSEGWKEYMDYNKNNNLTFAKVLENITALADSGGQGSKVNINGIELTSHGLSLVQNRSVSLDINNEKLWAGGRFLLRFDTPDGADKFLASIDTSALYRREAATHGSQYKGMELIEKKELVMSALLKGLLFGTHYGVDLQNNSNVTDKKPGHLYINKENHTLTYYASKIPLIGFKFQKDHYSEIQIGIENHPAPGVIGAIVDKIGIHKAAHSKSGESDGMNPIGTTKNIYEVKLNHEGAIKNIGGLNAYLNKVGINDNCVKGNWETLVDGEYEYKKIEDINLYFVKDSKNKVVFVLNPKTIKDDGEVIFNINGKIIDVDEDKVNQLKAVQEDSFTLKDTRDVLHGLIIMPQAYSVTKSIAKEVINPFPNVFGLGNISDYIPQEDQDRCEVLDASIVDLGSRALEVFNYAFDAMIGKLDINNMFYNFSIKTLMPYIKDVDNKLDNYPSGFTSGLYNFLIKPLAPDNLNVIFHALDFYFNGYSIFVIPVMKAGFEYFEDCTKGSLPTDESNTAYTYIYNSLYAGYSFSKQYLFYANNTGLYKTTFSSEKFTNAIGGAIGDVNKKYKIEEAVKDENVGIATYVADAGVMYGLSGNSTIATDKKWLPVKLASSLISYSFKAITFYNTHNAIKHVDNNYFGASDFANYIFTGAINLGKGAYKSEASGYMSGGISKLIDYILGIVAKENNELSIVSKAFYELLNNDKQSIFEEYKNEVFSFNAKNKAAFDNNKKTLAEKYLEEIEEYVDAFKADSATDFCKLEKEIAVYYTILHYTRKAGNLKEEDVMLSSSQNNEHIGYKFYKSHYEKQVIVQDFKSICALRDSIEEMAKEKENLIQEGEYKKFCKDNSDNILCSDFVKDVIFPELVDVNL